MEEKASVMKKSDGKQLRFKIKDGIWLHKTKAKNKVLKKILKFFKFELVTNDSFLFFMEQGNLEEICNATEEEKKNGKVTLRIAIGPQGAEERLLTEEDALEMLNRNPWLLVHTTGNPASKLKNPFFKIASPCLEELELNMKIAGLSWKDPLVYLDDRI